MYKMNHNNNETSKTIPYDSHQTDSNDSEWGLEIVIKSTPKKRRKKSIDPKDKKIIDEFEKDIEETLEEKAAKSNLSHTTVKSILKHVFTDEHVLALVKQKEGCEDVEGIIPYEPKITRSKAKELLSNTGSVISLPWQTRTTTSEVQALLTQDLQEDSSGDEYVPGEEESEDDISFSVSNPPTPAPQGTPIRQCTDDVEAEIFKTPKQNRKKYREQPENANIALRTRSKFCLNETPLEKIEQDFIPPDITTDMYEIYCNDDEWKEFLKSFTQPLEEVVKNTEDEDHDPEYNFLSDEEIETVDKEELRADKAVKVPKKELNALMAELFEYVDIYSQKNDDEKLACDETSDSTNKFQQQLLDSCREDFDFSASSNVTNDDNQAMEYWLRNSFTYSQLLLLQQQMQQHVQMLTQNFLLTYCHPFYADFSTTLKEYLLNFKFLSNGNKSSVFNCTNLENSLELVNSWEKLFENKDEAAMETRKQFAEVMEVSVKRYSKREYYHLPFPQLVFKTIADSDIFMYPYLLPQIPFKHPEILKKDIVPFSYSEYQLIALGLEQFIPHFMDVKEFMTKTKKINLKKIAELIHDFMMPARQPIQIYRQIYEKKHEKYLPNPIAYFSMHKKAPLTIHQVNPFVSYEMVPPRKRPPNLLPTQWRNYIWPEWRTNRDCEQHFPKPSIMLNEPKKQKIPKTLIKVLPKLSSDVNPKGETKKEIDSVSFKQKLIKSNDISLKIKFINCFRCTISYCEYYDLRRKVDCQYDSLASENIDDSMSLLGKKDILNVDNMPCLDIPDTNNRSILCNDLDITKNKEKLKSICDTVETSVLNSSKINFSKWNKDIKNCKTYTHDKNELHSSTCETKTKREKEFLSRLAMITPPELSTDKDKRVQFARTYFTKLKKTLHKADYIKVACIFQKCHKKKFNTIDLYKILSPILKPKYQTLVDELLLFLDLELANAIAKLIPFLLTNHLDIFKTNIEVYFKHEPLLWRKIEESFLELENKTFSTLDRLKNTILPILRSHPLLCHNILEIFLKETTPSSLLNSTWEINDIQNLDRTEYEKFSNSLANAEKCDCFCHKAREQGSHHECTNCGLRFVGGRIYCHSSEGYRIINITFPFDPNIDDNVISSNEISHNSSRTLNSECGSILETFNEIKEDIKQCEMPNKVKSKFGKRTGKKKQMLKGNIFKKNKMKPVKSDCVSLSECISKTACLKPTNDLSCKDKLTVQCVELEPCSNDLSQKNSPIKSLLDNNIENLHKWTREEDKVILQIFQQKIDEEAIDIIQKHLKNRSAEDIRTRFEVLMSLMQLMDN